MKFVVEKEIFEKLPTACFGVVVAKGIDNGKSYPTVDALLDESIAAAAAHFEGKKVKEEPEILPYREAFRALGINPNKFMCSSRRCSPASPRARACRTSTPSWTSATRFR